MGKKVYDTELTAFLEFNPSVVKYEVKYFHFSKMLYPEIDTVSTSAENAVFFQVAVK